MKTTGAALIMRLLERQGIDTIAGIPGGASLPLYDALRGSRIRHVLARHEQGMPRKQRPVVQKGDGIFVFVNHRGRNCTRRNPAKQTGFSGHRKSFLSI